MDKSKMLAGGVLMVLLLGAGCSTAKLQNIQNNKITDSNQNASTTDIDTTDDNSDVNRANAQLEASKNTEDTKTSPNVRRISVEPHDTVATPIVITGEAKG